MTKRNRNLTLVAAAAAALAITAPTASASVNMWATFGANDVSLANITRTTVSRDAPLGNTIDIENLGFSMTAGTSKAIVSNITFTKPVDLNTPALMASTMSKGLYASVKITVDGSGPGGDRVASSKVYCAEKAYVASVVDRIDDQTGDTGSESVSIKVTGEMHVGVKTTRQINPFNILSYDLIKNLSGFPNNGCQMP